MLHSLDTVADSLSLQSTVRVRNSRIVGASASASSGCLICVRVYGDHETTRCLSQSYFLLTSASFHSKETTCLHINLRHHRQRHDPRPRRLILGRMTAAISSTPSTELATVLCARPTVDLPGSRSTVGKHAKYVAQHRHPNQHYQLL